VIGWEDHFHDLLFSCCILISRFFNVKNLLNFNLADFPVTNQITAVTLMMMGNSKNLHLFHFTILLKHKNLKDLMLAKCKCFTVYCVECNTELFSLSVSDFLAAFFVIRHPCSCSNTKIQLSGVQCTSALWTTKSAK